MKIGFFSRRAAILMAGIGGKVGLRELKVRAFGITIFVNRRIWLGLLCIYYIWLFMMNFHFEYVLESYDCLLEKVILYHILEIMSWIFLLITESSSHRGKISKFSHFEYYISLKRTLIELNWARAIKRTTLFLIYISRTPEFLKLEKNKGIKQ